MTGIHDSEAPPGIRHLSNFCLKKQDKAMPEDTTAPGETVSLYRRE